MNNHIYILDIDMYIQTEDMKNQAYIDNDIRSPLKMLFIGEELTESTLFDLLSQSEISLHEVKVKYKFDYICQMSEDGYRYINNKLETVASLSLLRAIKDFGVNYNIIRNKSFLKNIQTRYSLRYYLITLSVLMPLKMAINILMPMMVPFTNYSPQQNLLFMTKKNSRINLRWRVC